MSVFIISEMTKPETHFFLSGFRLFFVDIAKKGFYSVPLNIQSFLVKKWGKVCIKLWGQVKFSRKTTDMHTFFYFIM